MKTMTDTGKGAFGKDLFFVDPSLLLCRMVPWWGWKYMDQMGLFVGASAIVHSDRASAQFRIRTAGWHRESLGLAANLNQVSQCARLGTRVPFCPPLTLVTMQIDLSMGHNLCLHFGADEHVPMLMFTRGTVYMALTHSRVARGRGG